MEDAHPIHAAAIGTLTYVATRNARWAAGMGVAVYVYMALFGHSLPSMDKLEIAPEDPTPNIILQGFQPRRRRLTR